MRELERDLPDDATPSAPAAPRRLLVVGRGRAGGAFARAARAAGLEVETAGREPSVESVEQAEAALLCVPDGEIAAACQRLVATSRTPALVGHASGATGLDALVAAASSGARTFSMHPLQTLPDERAELGGAPCAVAGSDPGATAAVAALARLLGMVPFEVPEAERAAYHAAASMASNFLVSLEESAAGLLRAAGLDDPHEVLGPLVLRTAANWAERGAAALTGPIVRGDEATVARHLAALAERAPELLPLYEALAERTRALSGPAARPESESLDSGGRRPDVVRTAAELRALLDPARRRGEPIGLVPTMGYLHDGHASLLRAARARCGLVVMSLFVNPAQFGPGEDLDSYPRDEGRDVELAAACGVDVVYAPSEEEVYPPGFATSVEVSGELTDVLCGAPERRGAEHFRGVTTVVAKLFATITPDLAFFGQKDAQQAIVVERMARDLGFLAEIVVVPTVREPDGLALSSRNAYLSDDERERATAIGRALDAAREAAAGGARTVTDALEAAREVLAGAGIEPEYLEARDARDLSAVESLNGRPVLVAVAARVGRARLIDNVVIGPRSSG